MRVKCVSLPVHMRPPVSLFICKDDRAQTNTFQWLSPPTTHQLTKMDSRLPGKTTTKELIVHHSEGIQIRNSA